MFWTETGPIKEKNVFTIKSQRTETGPFFEVGYGRTENQAGHTDRGEHPADTAGAEDRADGTGTALTAGGRGDDPGGAGEAGTGDAAYPGESAPGPAGRAGDHL